MRKCSSDLADYVAKQKSLDGYEIIETLKGFEELNVLYQKNAGIFAGKEYTVETQTQAVLDVFHRDFGNSEKFHRFLGTIHLPFFEQFKLFLALHAIGKGRAVEEGRTEKEVEYTIEIISRYAEKLQVDLRTIRIIEALLRDHSLGDYFYGELDVDEALIAAKTAGDHCGLSVKEIIQLRNCLCEIDISSCSGSKKGSSQSIAEGEHSRKVNDLSAVVYAPISIPEQLEKMDSTIARQSGRMGA